eukprot:TRINITY_DN17861_c0_g1_i4.p2 TRINITY_DN17861_c0_g1~~TRINITY_DN17861_c0_g1_i4.p2  ORF type:complete len:263 (-),score=71.39 TRINITY_DN17861_c0_g1_i4:178-966(-)
MPDIKILVKSAKGLKDADGPFNGSDPYVYLTLDGQSQQTSTVNGTSDPEWNEEKVFEGVEMPGSKILDIRVYDDDPVKDDKIGAYKLDLGKLIATSDPQDFEVIVDDGWFKDATLQFTVQTDGSFGNPEGGKGDLRVMVQSCTGLDDADFTGTTDPYCYVQIDGCEPQQTDTKDGTINPEWNQELVFEGIENPLSKTIKFTIYDKDTWSRDDKIGYCEVKLSDLTMGESKDYDLGVDFMLFGLIKQASLKFTLSADGWGNAA